MKGSVTIPKLGKTLTFDEILIFVSEKFPYLFTQEAVKLLQVSLGKIAHLYLDDPVHLSSLIDANNRVKEYMINGVDIQDSDPKHVICCIPTDIASKIFSMAEINILTLCKTGSNQDDSYISIADMYNDNNYWIQFLSNRLKIEITVDGNWRDMYNHITKAMNFRSIHITEMDSVLSMSAAANILPPIEFIFKQCNLPLPCIDYVFDIACRHKSIDAANYLIRIRSKRKDDINYTDNFIMSSIISEDLGLITCVFDKYPPKCIPTLISCMITLSISLPIFSFVVDKWDTSKINNKDLDTIFHSLINTKYNIKTVEELNLHGERRMSMLKILIGKLTSIDINLTDYLLETYYESVRMGFVEAIRWIDSLGYINPVSLYIFRNAVNNSSAKFYYNKYMLLIEIQKRKYKLIQSSMRLIDYEEVLKEFNEAVDNHYSYVYNALYDYVGEILNNNDIDDRLYIVRLAKDTYNDLNRDFSIDYSK